MARPAPLSPRDIHQNILDRTRDAYVDNDFDSFAAHFLLPQHVATYDGTRHLQTRDDLRAMFDAMRAFFARKGATHLERRTVTAALDGPDTIRATHEGRLMAGDTVVQTAWPAFSIVRLHEGVWKIAFSQYVVEKDHASAMGTARADLAPTSGETI